MGCAEPDDNLSPDRRGTAQVVAAERRANFKSKRKSAGAARVFTTGARPPTLDMTAPKLLAFLLLWAGCLLLAASADRHQLLVKRSHLVAGHRGRQPHWQRSLDEDNLVHSESSQLNQVPNSEPTKRQQPEQSPIVVSTSDNSYVSASPVEQEDQPEVGGRRAKIAGFASGLFHRHHSRKSARRDQILGPNYKLDAGKSSEISTTATTTSSDPSATSTADEDEDASRSADQVSAVRGPQSVLLARPKALTSEQVGFAGLSVDSHFESSSSSIIKTRESIGAGASFLDYTVVTSLSACLVECLLADSCDTAIYQETPVELAATNLSRQPPTSGHRLELDALRIGGGESSYAPDDADNFERDEEPSDANITFSRRRKRQAPEDPFGAGIYLCYLFQCGKADGFKCQFSAHKDYISSTWRNSRPPVVPHVAELHERQQAPEPQYARIVTSPANHHRFDARAPAFRDSHLGRISIGQEQDAELDYHERGGVNSAIIAILIGIGATGVLVMLVGHKMKSIRQRLAHKSRRRSLVPDADFLINTIPIDPELIEANLSRCSSLSSLSINNRAGNNPNRGC